jgi:hypothetical protein
LHSREDNDHVATRTFQLTTIVPAAPTAVIDFMVDLTRHHGLHPFVVSATVVESGKDDGVAWQDWRVVERPRLGPLRYTIRFPARMERRSPTSMRGTVVAAPGCTLVTLTEARSVSGETVLTESTTVSAPAVLVGYMTSQARIAHARTFRLLPGEFTPTH